MFIQEQSTHIYVKGGVYPKTLAIIFTFMFTVTLTLIIHSHMHTTTYSLEE